MIDLNFSKILKDVKEIGNNSSLIVVCKNQPLSKILPIIKMGHQHFGENRVQEAYKKWSLAKSQYPNIKLHMLGKLQSNKVNEDLFLFDYIHSLDSIKLADKLKKLELKTSKKIKYFIQVNIGKEDQKAGVQIEDLENLINFIKKEPALNILGLMCIPPLDVDAEKYFKKTRELSVNFGFKDTSMGMSNDFKIALKFGASFVRVGSSIFKTS